MLATYLSKEDSLTPKLNAVIEQGKCEIIRLIDELPDHPPSAHRRGKAVVVSFSSLSADNCLSASHYDFSIAKAHLKEVVSKATSIRGALVTMKALISAKKCVTSNKETVRFHDHFIQAFHRTFKD